MRENVYPEEMAGDKVRKANFRRACRKFSIVNGQYLYNSKRVVISSKERQRQIIQDIHADLGENPKAKAMASHRGRESTYQKISERFYWYDVVEFIKTCENCQKQGKNSKKIFPYLQSVRVPNEVMKQIGFDMCNLPEVNGYKHVIICIDYFSKWSEAKTVKDKTAPTVSEFLV